MGVIDQNISHVSTAWITLADGFNNYIPLLTLGIITLIVLFVIYKAVDYVIKKSTLKVKEEDRATILRVWHYGFAFLAAIVLLLTFSGNLGLTGVTLGLLSAALGFGLQKPISSIVAWLIILINKPFRVGDRIIIAPMEGDIENITMFYLVVKEVGGLIEGEVQSGRTILVPTSVIFDKPVINYKYFNQYITKEIKVSVTYESNLEKAQEIFMEVAREKVSKYIVPDKMEPHTRTKFGASSIDVAVRFPCPPTKMDRIAHEITQEIHKRVRESKEVEFAYPHMEVVFKKGTPLNMQKE